MAVWAAVSQDWAVVPRVPARQDARYWASIRERRWTKAVAVGETRLTAPPSAVRAMLPAPPRTAVIWFSSVWMPAEEIERSKKSERAAYVSRPSAPCGERPGVEPGRWHWASVGKERAARVHLHRLLVRAALQRDAARGGADAGRRGGRPRSGARRRCRGRRRRRRRWGAAGRVRQVAGRPDLVRLVRAPLLPGLHHGGGLRPRPGHVRGDALRGRVGLEAAAR